jgi:hypothetical protein
MAATPIPKGKSERRENITGGLVITIGCGEMSTPTPKDKKPWQGK